MSSVLNSPFLDLHYNTCYRRR